MSHAPAIIASLALLASTPTRGERDGSAGPGSWPDDAILAGLGLCEEALGRDPGNPPGHDRAPRLWSQLPVLAEEAARRRLHAAKPTLIRIHELSSGLRFPVSTGGGESPVHRVATAAAKLEVATGEWKRLVDTHLPHYETIPSAPGNRPMNAHEHLAVSVMHAMLADAEARPRLREWIQNGSDFVDGEIAWGLRKHVVHPTPADRELLMLLLREPRRGQLHVLLTALRDLSPAQRAALAREYLVMPSRDGLEAQVVAERVLNGTMPEALINETATLVPWRDVLASPDAAGRGP